jgi:hypothetical protein
VRDSGALLFGLGLLALVIAPDETLALLRAASKRKRPSPHPCGTPCRDGCPSWDRCPRAAVIDVEAVEVRR